MLRLLHPALVFLRRRTAVSYWVIILVVVIQLTLYYRSRPINLSDLSYARLAALQQNFIISGGKRDVENDWGLQLGPIDLPTYTAELKDAWALLFGDTTSSASRFSRTSEVGPVAWRTIARRLSLNSDPALDVTSSIPHRVWTTSGRAPERYPFQFRYWAENDPSLSFRHLNDTHLDTYLNTIYPPGTIMHELLLSLNSGKEGDEASTKKAHVLKADIFRYTILLHKGGIYTDIDTAAVKRFDDWGKGAVDLSDNFISQLSQVLHSPESISSISSPSQSPSASNTLSPSLIVAIEKVNDPSWHQRNMARGLQVTQWTIAAQPGHPVFVDVLDRIVGRWLEERTRKENGKEDVGGGKEGKGKESVAGVDDGTVLDWTGPGPWSDAVVRYILARHGLDPRLITTLNGSTRKEPVRIGLGDVLVLPERAFQADASEKESTANNEQHCVWHGFLGSWREVELPTWGEDEQDGDANGGGKSGEAASGRD